MRNFDVPLYTAPPNLEAKVKELQHRISLTEQAHESALQSLDNFHKTKIAELTAKCEKMQKLLDDAPKFFSPIHGFNGEKSEWIISAEECK